MHELGKMFKRCAHCGQQQIHTLAHCGTYRVCRVCDVCGTHTRIGSRVAGLRAVRAAHSRAERRDNAIRKAWYNMEKKSPHTRRRRRKERAA